MDNNYHHVNIEANNKSPKTYGSVSLEFKHAL